MSNYRISKAAREDLFIIAQYGDVTFGIPQSDRYRDLLKQRFSLLAKHPLLYPSVDYIRLGYRRSVCGVHSIYYRIDKDTIEI